MSIDSLFIPGQQLTHEAENLMNQVRNCGARLNRLKLARAAPDAPLWWQFLSSTDGSSESLDIVASDLASVLRELEHATSELKRLCAAPASDVAGNVQREMEKKRWAVGTIDRWCAVLKNAATDRAGTGMMMKSAAKSVNTTRTQSSSVMSQPQQQQEGEVIQKQQQPTNNSNEILYTIPEDQDGQKQTPPMLEMTVRRQELINNALSSMERIESLQDELDDTESNCTAALKLANKFRELEMLETRYGNLRTRRRQFQNQVHNHLTEIGKEIEKEARTRTRHAREYYDEHQHHNTHHVNKDLTSPLHDHHHHAATTTTTDEKCERCRQFKKDIEHLEIERKAKWVDRAVRVLCTQAVVSGNHASSHGGDDSSLVPAHRILALVASDKNTKKAVAVRPLFSRRITKPAAGSSQKTSSAVHNNKMVFDVPASLVLPNSRTAAKTTTTNKTKTTSSGGGAVASIENSHHSQTTFKADDSYSSLSMTEQQRQTQMLERAEQYGVAPAVEWNIGSAHDHTKSWTIRLNAGNV